jgi:hypothetical protein
MCHISRIWPRNAVCSSPFVLLYFWLSLWLICSLTESIRRSRLGHFGSTICSANLPGIFWIFFICYLDPSHLTTSHVFLLCSVVIQTEQFAVHTQNLYTVCQSPRQIRFGADTNQNYRFQFTRAVKKYVSDLKHLELVLDSTNRLID